MKNIIDFIKIELGLLNLFRRDLYSNKFWQRAKQYFCEHEKEYHYNNSPSYFECRKCKFRD